MKILGLEITINKSKGKGSKLPDIDTSGLDKRHIEEIVNQLTNKSMLLGGYIDSGKIIANTNNEFIKRIKWPSVDHLDEFDLVRYNNARRDLLSSASGYKGGHFSICPFHVFTELNLYILDPIKLEAYDKLRKLHCVEFVHMPLNVRTEMVELINFLFNGELGSVIEGEVITEPQKQIESS